MTVLNWKITTIIVLVEVNGKIMNAFIDIPNCISGVFLWKRRLTASAMQIYALWSFAN